LLLEKAREGKVVVRLKGGDPFVLGRGGEEAGILTRHGIPFEVVPGVTSASAVPAYAGIPITHREVASSFAVITGHKASDRGEPRISWDKLATGADTLIILMGMRNLAKIVDQLIKHGRPPSTPVAVITQGTTSRQRCLVGTLQDIVDKVGRENLQPPSVVVVGDVVRLREYLRWFDK
jgi:uroporphyrinogen III methyltransferase/synthase